MDALRVPFHPQPRTPLSVDPSSASSPPAASRPPSGRKPTGGRDAALDRTTGDPHTSTKRSDTRQASDTRAALLASGRRIFADRGYAAATVREITHDAGVNLGAITYHFGSKRALYAAVVETGIRPLAARVEAAAGLEGSAPERVAAVVDAYFRHLQRNADLPRLLLQEVAAGRRPPQVVIDILERNARLISGIVEDGIAEGTIRPGHPLWTALSVVSQPIYFALVGGLIREVAGIDLSDPATLDHARQHTITFVRRALEGC